MEHLDILIVCSPDRYFPQLVMDHLLIQNIPIRLFFSNVKGDGAASARNFAKEMWQNSLNKSHYVLMSDNDIIFPDGSLQAMINFLDQHQDFGAISLNRNDAPQIPETEASEPTHINAGPVLFRSEVFEQIQYHNNDGCECQGMSNDVRRLGYRIGYLGSWKYDHIDQTRKGDYQENIENPPPPDPNQQMQDPPMEVHLPSNEMMPEDMIPPSMEIHPETGEIIPPPIEQIPVEDHPIGEVPIEEVPHIDPNETFDAEEPVHHDSDPVPPPPPTDPLTNGGDVVHQILGTISYQLSELISESKAIRSLLEQRPL